MNYIDEIFNRCDIDKISNFLLYGCEPIENNNDNYYERAKKADKKLNEWLKEEFSEYECRDRQSSFIYSIISEIQSIYMQIGLCTGIMLSSEYFSKNSKAKNPTE